MPHAVAVGLPKPHPQISASLSGYQSNFSYTGEGIRSQTNCYLDLWIETLHALKLDPAPAFACALSANQHGFQWTSLERQGEDLRRLYDLEVTEEIEWLPLRETVSIDAPGWIPPDKFSHLLAATLFSVRPQRYCDHAARLGKAASVDPLDTTTITASA